MQIFVKNSEKNEIEVKSFNFINNKTNFVSNNQIEICCKICTKLLPIESFEMHS